MFHRSDATRSDAARSNAPMPRAPMPQVAVDFLRQTDKVSTLGLWGRSMGAVTALLYSQRDPSIAGIVSVHCIKGAGWMGFDGA